MKNKPTIRGAVALLLCLCCLCVPLMGMTTLASAGTEEPASREGCLITCHCTVRCTENVKNPGCPGCQDDLTVCIGKRFSCICAEKCTEEKRNASCPACSLAIWPCTGKEPEPAPVCACDVKCTDTTKNADCTVCAASVADCKGKTPEPVPVCDCAAKCKTGAIKDDCPICKNDIAGCVGKEPAPAPVCACDVKCTDTTKNADCPVCAASVADCKGKTPEPVPVCGCSVKCKAGAVNTACPICKTDMTGCKGKDSTPTPAPAGSYAISIVAPSGWYNKTAKVEIRVADENDTGWKKVEARIERNGSAEDLTDAFAGSGKVYVAISENCTIYVTVTGKDGKTTTKSRYIECFDRTAPTVKTGLDGRVLRVEATDELSGVEAIYIDGDRYTDLTNGTLDVRLRDLGKEYDQFSIQAVDYAGNKSRTVQVKNPNYKAPTTEKPSTTTPAPTPTPTPAPTPSPTPTPTPTPGGGTATKPSTGNSGGSGNGNTGGAQWEGLDPAEPEVKEPNPFTPSGTGTVIDNATDSDGKEFYTIQTPAENVFYLVIDRQRGTENVYFLNAVTEVDLAALAESTGEPVTPAPTPTPEPDPEPTPAPDEQPEPEQKQSGNMGMLLLVLAVAAIGGGAAFYFKVYRPKHQPAEPEEDYGDDEELYAENDGDALWDEDGGEEEPTE